MQISRKQSHSSCAIALLALIGCSNYEGDALQRMDAPLLDGVKQAPSMAVALISADEQKLARERSGGLVVDSGYASSLEEEEFFRAQALDESVSPGAFVEGGRLVSRLYAEINTVVRVDVSTIKSRFTRVTLDALRQRLAALEHRTY